MNTVTLIGRTAAAPVYYCNHRAQDIARLQLVTLDRRGGEHVHHCVAFGPAAIDLHTHLRLHEQLAIRGELLYRDRRIGNSVHKVPYVLIRQYTYLSSSKPVRAAEVSTVAPAAVCAP